MKKPSQNDRRLHVSDSLGTVHMEEIALSVKATETHLYLFLKFSFLKVVLYLFFLI